MILSLFALATSAALPFADDAHEIRVEHQGSQIQVSYRADTKVSTRRIGMPANNRPSTERCLWTARVGVIREARHANGATLSHRLDAQQVLQGSQPGNCEQNKTLIAKEVARRGDVVRAHLAAVAARDGERLAADLSAAGQFSAD